MRRPIFHLHAALALLCLGGGRGFAAAEAEVAEVAEVAAVGTTAGPSAEGIEFFEKHIRPLLAERCYECHSVQAKKSKGGLLLDSQKGIAAGGTNGPVILPGDVENSPLIMAIRWNDPDQAMPPKGKLAPQEVEKLEQWVRMGAPDPRTEGAAPSLIKAKTRDPEADRQWWAFLPLAGSPVPEVTQPEWARKPIDFFVLNEMESRQLQPSPKADPRSLLVRLYLDLTGLRPSYAEVGDFVREPTEKAYAEIVEKLLASPEYGQRWGRHWLDVARYAEDNPTTEASNPPYPNAWRYRDWVIDAMNRDLPYNQFVSLQLAADLIPGTPRGEMAATGFLGIGPVYHKDARLSKDVIENLAMDDWDERVDVVSRGVLGLTVACARCHDHKTDPVSTRDYYALAGVFASTAAAPRSLTEVDSEVETRAMAASQRLFYLSYVANLLRGEPGSSPREARKKVEGFVRELEGIQNEIADLRQSHPALHAQLSKLDRRPTPYENADPPSSAPAAAKVPDLPAEPKVAQAAAPGKPNADATARAPAASATAAGATAAG
ncbi:MAG: hypothetical protein JWL81_1626, partial [Verrucomicrobiales bacterium]|nr:hypothetical protein [Verrucomicrobiales bacterium]